GEPTAAELHRLILRRKGDIVGIRKVQMVIKDLKERRGNDNQETVQPWRPWQLDTETPEQTDYLLELRRQGEIVGVGRLSTSQAEWAKKIRISLRNIAFPMVPYLVSHIYDVRQKISVSIARPETFFTDDLDQYLAYKPWLSNSRRKIYDEGLRSGNIKYPIVFFLGNAYREISTESRLQMVKCFGLPERLAYMSVNELSANSEMDSDDIDYLFRVAGLIGVEESLISYATTLINQFRDSSSDTNLVPGFGGLK
ncbi:MAG: hypothetical protein BZY82_07890, partial [SAR202 cluster bacterium Io17-Chloro-G3]